MNTKRCLAALCGVLLLAGAAQAQYIPFKILFEDDALPVSGLIVESVTQPCVNASGVVAFQGDVDGTATDDFLWVGSAPILIPGQAITGTVGTVNIINAFDSFRHINATGNVAWTGQPLGAPTTEDQILCVNDAVLLKEGAPSPVGGAFLLADFTQVSIDDAGNVYCEGDDNQASADEFIMMVTPGGVASILPMNVASVFRESQLIVGGLLDGLNWETATTFSDTVCNGVGAVITDANLDELVGVTIDNDDVIIRKQPGLDYEVLTRAGDTIATPLAGNLVIESYTVPILADNNDWAVRALVDSVATNDSVLIAGIGGGAAQVVAQESTDIAALTGVPGTAIGTINGHFVPGNGKVLFTAIILNDGVTIPAYNDGIFQWEAGTLSLLMVDEIGIVNMPGASISDFSLDAICANAAGGIFIEGLVGTPDGIFELIIPSVTAVEDLTCSLIGNNADLSWVIPAGETYTGYNIYVNGVLETTIAGNQTGHFTAALPFNQNSLICVEPLDGAIAGPQACCLLGGPAFADLTFCVSPGVAIPDVSSVDSVQSVSQVATVEAVWVRADITHTEIADLDPLLITSPAGTSVEMMGDDGGTADNVLSYFADSGAPNNSEPYNLQLWMQVNGPGVMADFKCEQTQGDWTLGVTDDLTGDIGTLNEWCLGIEVDPVPAQNCCTAPTGITCATTGACGAGEVLLAWTNNATYFALELVRTGGAGPVTIPLAPGATTHSDTAAFGPTYTYTLRYICGSGGIFQTGPACNIAHSATFVPPVTSLVCTPDFCANTVSLTWNHNNVPYTQVEVLRQGVVIANVTGQSSFVDTTPAAGTYSVLATCGASSAPANCVIALDFPAITDFGCALDLGTGDVTMTWTNGASYTLMELRRNGILLVPQPPIGSISYVDPDPLPGCNTYELTVGCLASSAIAECVIGTPGPADAMLMVPDSLTDTIGLYSAECGAYIGDLIAPGGAFTPSLMLMPIYGPDGRIYISDQTADAVWRFERDGTFVDQFANNATHSLDNVRGLHFRGTDLLIGYDGATGNEGVRLVASTGADLGLLHSVAAAWDPHTLSDGSFLLSASSGDVFHVAADGLTSVNLNLPGLSFCEQVGEFANGNFYVVEFTNDSLIEFGLAGNVVNTWDIGAAGTPRGAYPLGNGNIMITGSEGVLSLDPVSGTMSMLNPAVNGYMIGLLPPDVPVGPNLVRGDCNDDTGVNIADAIFLLGFLFPGANPSVITCDDACDANDDEAINIADAIAVLGSLFGSTITPLPFPNMADGCGLDPDPAPLPDNLGCAQHLSCP